MATMKMPSASVGGSSQPYYFEEWISSTADETKNVTLDFEPLTMLSISSGNYGTMWKRSSVGGTWGKEGVNSTSYGSSYITAYDDSTKTVTLKNIHSGTTTYKFYASGD